MRMTSLLILGTLCFAPQVQAQTPPQPPPGATAQPTTPEVTSPSAFAGQVDFGFRGTLYTGNSDRARYQRYRDLRNGAIADALSAGKEAGTWGFDIKGEHIGYRDQRYLARYNRPGKLKLSFEFNQIPLFFSEDTATPYTSPNASNVLVLPDPTQSAIQNGTAKSSAYVPIASAFDLQLQRSITDVRMVYSATKTVDLSLMLRNTVKKGQQPWAGTFGFSNAVELAVPVDTNSTDLGLAAEWMNDRADVRLGYDGSFFRNGNQTLVWDNPLRLTDSPTAGPAQGREALWPNSNQDAGTLSGILKLPARSQATAYVSLGDMTQDQTLIPFTINSALASPPLDRATAETKARITATAFSLNTRAIDHVALNARFRSYDFNNQTPAFHLTNTVAYDTTIEAFAEGTNTLYSFNRKTFDADASWTPVAHAALRAAYTRDDLSQTFRTFDSQHEDFVRLSADGTGMKWVTVRGVYEYSKRVGTGLDEQSLDDIGEQSSLRQFDIANRTTNRFTALAIVQASSGLSLNVNGSVTRATLPQSSFGLQQSDADGIGFGVDYVPNDKVSAGGSYLFERYHTLQRSRQANPGVQFDDPTRDWTTDGKDRAHTIQASVDLLKFWPKTDVRLAYDFSDASSNYIYGLTPNTTLPPVAQLPQILNRRHRLTADARRTFTAHWGADVMVWYETYHVDDYAFSPQTLNSIAQPSFLILGYQYRPYTASTIQARLTYLW